MMKSKYSSCQFNVTLYFQKIDGDDQHSGGWSGGAMVLGKLPVPGRPTIWITVGQGPTALAVGAGGGCLDIFTLIYPFFPLSPSLWETARYRLKYCLKGPLNPKPTNQPTNTLQNPSFFQGNFWYAPDAGSGRTFHPSMEHVITVHRRLERRRFRQSLCAGLICNFDLQF